MTGGFGADPTKSSERPPPTSSTGPTRETVPTAPNFSGTIRGGAGGDTLTGAAAQDGGDAGTDTIRLPTLTPFASLIGLAAPDRITDPDAAEDRIELVLNRASDVMVDAERLPLRLRTR